MAGAAQMPRIGLPQIRAHMLIAHVLLYGNCCQGPGLMPANECRAPPRKHSRPCCAVLLQLLGAEHGVHASAACTHPTA